MSTERKSNLIQKAKSLKHLETFEAKGKGKKQEKVPAMQMNQLEFAPSTINKTIKLSAGPPRRLMALGGSQADPLGTC